MDVFVFGSNRKGIHGAGAALYAVKQYGARRGTGEGRTGKAYALPTKATPYELLTLEQVAGHVETFLAHAAAQPGVRFLLTKVGCGLALSFRTPAGEQVTAPYTERDIAALFASAPENVVSIDERGQVVGPASQWLSRLNSGK